MCKTAERAVLFTKILAIEEVFWGKHVVWAVVHGGGWKDGCGASGREVLYNNSKIILFRFFIPKKYTNFATACVWEEAKAAGQRLHCRGPDEEEFFRLFPLHTLDYKRFTNK